MARPEYLDSGFCSSDDLDLIRSSCVEIRSRKVTPPNPSPPGPVARIRNLETVDRLWTRWNAMVWQPDVWAEALRCTEHTSFRLCRTMDECVRVCAQ